MSILIPLTGKRGTGKSAIIDEDDFLLASKYRWHLSASGYVRAHPKMGGPFIYLHVLIIGGAKKGMEVDHKNRNPLDNRKENLRRATKSENISNILHYNQTGFRGVSRDHKRNVFRAFIRKNNRVKYLGTFSEAENAALAYDSAAKEAFGEFAILNFSQKPMGERTNICQEATM